VSSEEGPAFVLDCGSDEVIRQIQDLQARTELGQVEGLWITHYHDDHVDAVPRFLDVFDCPVIADEHVAQIIEQPLAWRLPCISPAKVTVDRRTTHGEFWQWHEFTMTAYHLPGQTLYHGGLLVEGHGQRILFAGDSFTMAGIDDYCTGNRNYLGQGVGFDACLSLVEALAPDHILNCHVDQAFRFTQSECTFMRANLAKREALYGELLPWNHPNYGLDEHWVRCHPYEQQIAPGERVQLAVIFTNHSNKEREAMCRPVLPAQWGVQVRSQTTVIPPKAENGVLFSFTVPVGAQNKRYIVPVEVTYHGRRLGQFREAILAVKASSGG
jgi:glyoxylase-like metal-dependent hydrolase (beta-lactamase superfamily II)